MRLTALTLLAVAGLVLAPYVTGGLLLLALVGAVLAADDVIDMQLLSPLSPEVVLTDMLNTQPQRKTHEHQ